MRPALAALSLLSLTLPAGHAQAAVYRVGLGLGGESCTHLTIQAAINAAEGNPGPDTILVARSVPHLAQELLIDTDQELEIIGGYATCNSTAPAGTTTLDGSGGNAMPVLRVHAPSAGAKVVLRNLFIRGGDVAAGGEGGGIYFEGNGTLEIHDSSIDENVSGYGGGIYARGTGTEAELRIGANVLIMNNTARFSGGGVYVDQLEMAMEDAGSVIAFNTAEGQFDSGFGGGLVILGKTRSAHAWIGSAGAGITGAIFNNQARYGGGVAIIGDTNSSGMFIASELRLFTSDATRPGAIRGNVATVAGGGIYVRGHEGSAGNVHARARLWYADLADNAAPQGAAVFLGDHLSNLWFNFGPPLRGLSCPTGAPCGRVTHHSAVDILGQPADGALFEAPHGGGIHLGRSNGNPFGGIVVRDNTAGRIVNVENGLAFVLNALIADNTLGQELIRAAKSGVQIHDVTVAGNTVGAPHLLSVDQQLDLRRSILWQPGTLSLGPSENPDVHHVIAHEVASLGGGAGAQSMHPRFIDPDNGDYRLRAASPAVDFAPTQGPDDRDTDGRPRNVDLPVVPNVHGTRDIGAYERQDLLPIALNANFDGDLHMWSSNPYTTWNSDNAVGGSGSGSALVLLSDTNTPSIEGSRQCMHLPGPGSYRLNGFGRTPGVLAQNRDYLTLRWRLRFAGSEACSAGPANRTGDHQLPRQTTFATAATPAVINVSPSEWTPTTSLEIILVVSEGSLLNPHELRGYFDGISLAVETLGDEMFADGFETPLP